MRNGQMFCILLGCRQNKCEREWTHQRKWNTTEEEKEEQDAKKTGAHLFAGICGHHQH